MVGPAPQRRRTVSAGHDRSEETMGVGEIARQLRQARKGRRGKGGPLGHRVARDIVGNRSGQERDVDPASPEGIPQPVERSVEGATRQVPPGDDVRGPAEEEEACGGGLESDPRSALRRLDPFAGENVLAPDPREGGLCVVREGRQQRSARSRDQLGRVMEEKARFDQVARPHGPDPAPVLARLPRFPGHGALEKPTTPARPCRGRKSIVSGILGSPCPPGGAMIESDWREVGGVEELSQKELAQVEVQGTPLCLSVRDGRFAAISGVCNHAGGPLGAGRLDGDYVVCPWHHWKFHRADRRGRAGLRGRSRSRATNSKVEAGTAVGQPRRGHAAARASPTPHPLARPIRREDGTAPRRSASRPRRWTPPTPRFSTSDALLESALEHAGARSGAETRLDHRSGSSRSAHCEGYYSKSGPRLHVALLDHPDGSAGPAGPGLRGDRPLGATCPGRHPDPLGRRQLALLQDGRAD